MKDRLVDFGLLLLRLGFGLGIAYHGYQKIFGGRMEKFTEGVASMGFPAPAFFAWFAALGEFAGGLLLAAGLATRLSAYWVATVMAVAAFVRHGADPFDRKELALAYLVAALALALAGGGRFALERLCCKGCTSSS
jgi:putative oxidoreductase